MLAVLGTANWPMFIEVNWGATFYQHPVGDDRPPLGGIIKVLPSLAFDTFVTIGVKCVGDLDGNGGVGIVDFLLLLANWGPCPDPCPPACVADIATSPGAQPTVDCTVDISDMLVLLGNWGSCSAIAGGSQAGGPRAAPPVSLPAGVSPPRLTSLGQ